MIWKFPLSVSDYQEVMLPESAEIIHVGVHHHFLHIWVALIKGREKLDLLARKIFIHGTGHEIDDYDHKKHLGTVIMDYHHGVRTDPMVWHVFEGRKE